MSENFLDSLILALKNKSKQVNLAVWLLETTGSEDAAVLRAELDIELRTLLSNREIYNDLLSKSNQITDPILKREHNVLIRAIKPNLIPKELLEKIARAEAHLNLLYSNFRPIIDGKVFSDNDIREVLKTETNVSRRKQVWEASKEIGRELAPHILKLVQLRNESAEVLGYSNYFSMQLELQEVEEKQLFQMLDDVAEKSDEAYSRLIDEMNADAASKYQVSEKEIGPWAWAEPFCQEDPMGAQELDGLVQNVDILSASKEFYKKMGMDVSEILERSDNFERPGKNQHAFCINIDREKDVRTLNNIKPMLKWLETVLHELGHAVYELGFSHTLPWLLREPPHMITTEAMALIAGRQAYRASSLKILAPHSNPALRDQAEISLRRRQLIFSRWVLVMTYFERELYRNPKQDLNALWWELVCRFQKVHSKGSQSGHDWAAKYHIGLAPVYYFSYLLGEFLASFIEESNPEFASKATGQFLHARLFEPGNRFSWNELIENISGSRLSPDAWLSQFA
jgi:peptidyl-dipeptidase A